MGNTGLPFPLLPNLDFARTDTDQKVKLCDTRFSHTQMVGGDTYLERGKINKNVSVKPPGSHQSIIQDVSTVGGSQHYDMICGSHPCSKTRADMKGKDFCIITYNAGLMLLEARWEVENPIHSFTTFSHSTSVASFAAGETEDIYFFLVMCEGGNRSCVWDQKRVMDFGLSLHPLVNKGIPGVRYTSIKRVQARRAYNPNKQHTDEGQNATKKGLSSDVQCTQLLGAMIYTGFCFQADKDKREL